MSYIQPPLPFTLQPPVGGNPLSPFTQQLLGGAARGGMASLPGAFARGLPGLPPLNVLPSSGATFAMGPIGSTGLAAQAAQSAPSIASSMARMPAETTVAAQMARAAGAAPRATAMAAPGRMLAEAGSLGRFGRAARGFGYPLLGEAASLGIDYLNPGGQNSNLEQGLQGAAVGAGIGAGVGSVVPLLGTGVGAVAGGALGGAIGVLANTFGGGGGGDGEEADPLDVIATAMRTANLSPEATENILTQYETAIALADRAEDDKTKKQLKDAALEQTAQLIIATMQQEQLQADAQMDLSGPNLLAMQQQAQDIFQPLADDLRTNASLYAQAMSDIRGNLPKQYQPFADLQVANEMSGANKLAAAYQAQAALTPMVERLTQYQQDKNALANQLWQQQQSAMLNPGSGTDTLVQQGLIPTG